jgi:hypothetical protein
MKTTAWIAGASMLSLLALAPATASADRGHHYGWYRHHGWRSDPSFSIQIGPGYRDGYYDRYSYGYGPSWRYRHWDWD